jgi:transposase
MMGVLDAPHPKDLDVPQPTFDPADLASFCLLDDLGLTVTGQHLQKDCVVLACDVTAADRWCHRCGAETRTIGTVHRRLSHVPFGSRPTVLHVRVRRYRCDHCHRVWQQDTTAAAEPRAKLSRTALAWALRALVVDHRSVASISHDLQLSWSATNAAILAEGKRRLIDDPGRFDGVRVLGVDEHVWRHTTKGDKYVTVVIDLTPVKNQTGPARLLDMVPGRSKQVFDAWLAERDPAWRQKIEVVAMDGSMGFKTAATEQVPDAVEVLDPFHVVKLGAEAVNDCRRRLQREQTGRRGRKDDPLYRVRRVLLKGADLLTPKQDARIQAVLESEEHLALRVTWEAYQQLRAIYHQKTPARAKVIFQDLLAKLQGVPWDVLPELHKLATTILKRAGDIAAYFDRPGTSNGPTEALNGRLEHLRGIALGFRNLTHYIARSLLEAGGFRPRLLHPQT